MDRRVFIKACSTLAVASLVDASIFSQTLANTKGTLKRYTKALLVKEDGSPLREEDIKPHTQYIFFYPYASTPCYLINLDREIKPVELKLKDGGSYTWQGGAGKKRSLVAYSAICPHQLSHPTKDYSFINYYPPDKPSETTKKGGIIQCCAHVSLFDPAEGGKVLDGPAEFPLAAILLETEGDKIYAVGTVGVDQFTQFFENFKQDLIQQYGSLANAKKMVESCTVVEIKRYTKEVIHC
ncbi:Rieske (2Fe-2S) iron-sulphur domain protein [Thermocrinis albus DSM 14484]|uniref:Rieske (2Fe-2S) iron-sulphur domain protein n=1 Tax=Thermocrinis albus (strain DSM 14484 / JCM 11386 / HI 11/12) TaxID=638303 RepID=D3SPL0_THEAH|nr:Rieske 2Fe-2S domain-containing protein [Thermocrinis albus]ADC89097.1 Rieske (2Fe-2S) iron-sulphur domain protein [Thermocrinis albus DSM 14484]